MAACCSLVRATGSCSAANDAPDPWNLPRRPLLQFPLRAFTTASFHATTRAMTVHVPDIFVAIILIVESTALGLSRDEIVEVFF